MWSDSEMTPQNIKLTCKCQNNYHIEYLRNKILRFITVNFKN